MKNLFYVDQLSKAKDHYLEVLSLDAVCTEAMFNLGLTFKKMNNYDSALTWFEKLNSIIRSSPEVIYQIADM
jgi:intraflagellar transport protein 88